MSRDLAICRCPLLRDAAGSFDERADTIRRQILARVGTGGLGNLLLHQRATEVVAAGV